MPPIHKKGAVRNKLDEIEMVTVPNEEDNLA
jgi:hypothetical protein